MESLIGEIGTLRGENPGVLGAWYWENRNAIASLYLDVMLQQSGVNTRGFVDGLQVLTALEWVRTLGSSERLEHSRPEDATPPSAEQLRLWLGRLQAGQRVLSFYFSGESVYALVADARRVRMREMEQGARINRQLAALHDALQAGDDTALNYLQTLGSLMLEPLASELGETLFFAPAGPMNGLPLDAFVVNGAFVAERHRVVNSLSMSSVARQLPAVPEHFTDHVFLAGRPQDSQELFEYDLQVAPEVARLTDRFVGPGLHVVQGVALSREEFRDERFAAASLIHLAAPGMMNLAFPEQSILRLSGTEDDPGRGLIFSADIRELAQSAALVTLSGTGTRGQSSSGFDRRLGLVSDFLDTGAGAVMASLWPLPQESVAAFMDAFYAELASEHDVLQALVHARRERLANARGDDFLSWAGFQLYIR
jgi:CHAT domain-containing protein